MGDPIGTIAALWRYPVKSMQGEALEEAFLTERGVLGDRAYAVIDVATGHVASAKHPRKWAGLFACRAAFTEPPAPGGALSDVRITLPDGTIVSSADAAVHRELSRVVGREVRLVAQTAHSGDRLVREADRTPLDATEGTTVVREEPLALAAASDSFVDVAPLHLLTTATLEHLGTLAPASRFEPRRFRPNVLVRPATNAARTTTTGFVENDWLGLTLAAGEARISVNDPCPRCVVTTLAVDDLPQDPAVLRAIVRANAVASRTVAPGVVFAGVVGVYAAVARVGAVHRDAPLYAC